jgi:hypothetical protein
LYIPPEDGQQGSSHLAAKYKKYKINNEKLLKDGSTTNLDNV